MIDQSELLSDYIELSEGGNTFWTTRISGQQSLKFTIASPIIVEYVDPSDSKFDLTAQEQQIVTKKSEQGEWTQQQVDVYVARIRDEKARSECQQRVNELNTENHGYAEVEQILSNGNSYYFRGFFAGKHTVNQAIFVVIRDGVRKYESMAGDSASLIPSDHGIYQAATPTGLFVPANIPSPILLKRTLDLDNGSLVESSSDKDQEINTTEKNQMKDYLVAVATEDAPGDLLDRLDVTMDGTIIREVMARRICRVISHVCECGTFDPDEVCSEIVS